MSLCGLAIEHHVNQALNPPLTIVTISLFYFAIFSSIDKRASPQTPTDGPLVSGVTPPPAHLTERLPLDCSSCSPASPPTDPQPGSPIDESTPHACYCGPKDFIYKISLLLDR